MTVGLCSNAIPELHSETCLSLTRTWAEGGGPWDNIGDNGKENGNYRDYRVYIGNILGSYWDNGKWNGNYCGLRAWIVWLGFQEGAYSFVL